MLRNACQLAWLHAFPYSTSMLSGAVARGFTLFLLVGLPLMAARNSRLEEHVEAIEAARPALYLSAALTLLLIAGLTAIVAAWQAITPEQLGWTVSEPVVELGWGLAATAAGLGIAWLSGLIGRRAGLEESPLLRLLLPSSGTERRAFLVLAGIGAVCEEYIYRGFALHVLADWTGQQWGAAALTSISFGLAHGYQRVNGILRSAGLGMVLAVPVLWTGSLFPAILAHFWINAAMSSPASRWLLADVRAADVGASDVGSAGESTDREDDSTDSTHGDGT